mgnify:FL=1|jgi:hypothetical protein
MNWDTVLKIVLSIVGSVGGAGAIIAFVVKFSANLIADKLKKKYELETTKKLEEYKSKLENKNYISKTRFDTEFSIYRTLSVAFFDMVKNISVMIPEGYTQVPADPKVKKEYDKKVYNLALTAVVKAQDTLNGNAPFISEDMYNEYSAILKLCNLQLEVFSNRWNVLYLASQEEKEKLDLEDYKRTGTINESMKELNNKVRKYISTLDVIE